MKKHRILPCAALAASAILILAGCGKPAKEYPNFGPDKVIEYTQVKHGVTTPMAAVILFEYEMDNYTKYQVSYLSCTCRSASENYQQLMYIEINNNNDGPEEATIRNIKYQFWGDSPVNPENGVTYQDIEREYLPYLQYKSKAQIDKLRSLKDLTGVGKVVRTADATSGASASAEPAEAAAEPAKDAGGTYDFVDAYTGASVSIDNSLAILHALFRYHADKYYNRKK